MGCVHCATSLLVVASTYRGVMATSCPLACLSVLVGVVPCIKRVISPLSGGASEWSYGVGGILHILYFLYEASLFNTGLHNCTP